MVTSSVDIQTQDWFGRAYLWFLLFMAWFLPNLIIFVSQIIIVIVYRFEFFINDCVKFKFIFRQSTREYIQGVVSESEKTDSTQIQISRRLQVISNARHLVMNFMKCLMGKE